MAADNAKKMHISKMQKTWSTKRRGFLHTCILECGSPSYVCWLITIMNTIVVLTINRRIHIVKQTNLAIVWRSTLAWLPFLIRFLRGLVHYERKNPASKTKMGIQNLVKKFAISVVSHAFHIFLLPKKAIFSAVTPRPGKGAMNCPRAVGGVKLTAANSTSKSTQWLLAMAKKTGGFSWIF